jgi:hypothetical protein
MPDERGVPPRMSDQASKLHTPRVDDRPLWDVMFGIWGYPAVRVAHELKLFELLADKPLTLPEICEAKELAARPADILLAVCSSLGLTARRSLFARRSVTRIPAALESPILRPVLRRLAAGHLRVAARFIARGSAQRQVSGCVLRSRRRFCRMACRPRRRFHACDAQCQHRAGDGVAANALLEVRTRGRVPEKRRAVGSAQ